MSVVDGGVVEGAGGVDDRRQRVLVRDGGEECGELVAVAGVAGGDGDLGSGGAEFFDKLGGAGGARSLPAGQEQVADAVLADEVAGERGRRGCRCHR